MGRKNPPISVCNTSKFVPPKKWEDAIKHILRRDWNAIRHKWSGVSGLARKITLPIEHGIGDLQTLKAACAGHEQCVPWSVENVAGVREGIMIESYVLLLKAMNVLGGAQLHIDQGACAWSLSSGYHASFFAAKSICGLFGVALVELDRTVLIDAWTPPDDLPRKKRYASVTSPDKILLYKWRKSRVDHEPVWKMFQRILRVSAVENSLWPRPVTDFLMQCQSDSFASHRNRLHYENHYWPFCDELSCFEIRDSFARLEKVGGFNEKIDRLIDADDFSVVLGFALCWLANVLFSDLSRHARGLEENAQQLEASLSQAYHQRFRDYRDDGFLRLA